MKKFFKKTVLGIAGMLALLTVPASASTSLSFNFGTGSGTWTDSGGVFSGTMTISQLVETDVATSFSQTFNFPSGDYLSLSFNSGTPALSIMTTGSAGSPLSNVGADVALYGATTSLVFNSSASTPTILAESVTSGNATSVNATFLQDLFLPALTTFAISGGITGLNGNIISDSLVFTTTANTATPEPGSVLLFGAGLLAIAVMVRKRRVAGSV